MDDLGEDWKRLRGDFESRLAEVSKLESEVAALEREEAEWKKQEEGLRRRIAAYDPFVVAFRKKVAEIEAARNPALPASPVTRYPRRR